MPQVTIPGREPISVSQIQYHKARRALFLARFIVLRENKRSKAHRLVEKLEWSDTSTAEDIAEKIRACFKINGDSLRRVEADIKRSIQHADNNFKYFIDEYQHRSSNTFLEALKDYERSNCLLFFEKPQKITGWSKIEQIRKSSNITV